MCGIASLLLLQRLKRSMSSHANNSTTSRSELSSSFFFLQGKEQRKTHAILPETLRDMHHRMIPSKLGGQFKRGDFSTCFAPRPGRLKTVTSPDIIVYILKLFLEDPWISAKSIAEYLGTHVRRSIPTIMNI